MNDIRFLRLGSHAATMKRGGLGWAILDVDTFEYLNASKWTLSNGYPSRAKYFDGEHGRKYYLFMHHMIVGFPLDGDVDHKNGCKFDNRRCNLRIATHAQNLLNSPGIGRKRKYSQFRGVTKNKHGRWTANLRASGKTLHVGTFESEVEAAVARDAAAVKHHGEFARLNFP